ncbi:MAG: hypothetical protein KDD78_17975, partial [Caldilineaceae bacterium]|nr:hypothetical protein [Caldilineaceae bacterium]
RIAKRFETPAREAALTNAMTAALAETVAALSDDPVLQAHLADLLGQWVAQEDAAEELAEVLDPTSDHVLEMDLLVTAFEELGFDPTSLDQSRTFGEIAGLFAGELARALDREETLQGEIQTRLLRGLYDQVAALLAGQAALHSTIEDAAERFHPLDLDDLDQRYLLGLYNDCNELPMAADAQVDLRLRPQLQRVYVDLDIDRAPDAALLRARLAALGIDGAQLTAAVQTLDRDTRASGAARRGAARQGAAMNPALEQELEQDQEIALLRSLQGDELAKIAKALHVEQDALISTGDAVSVLELLQRERQVVLLGDPGSGKSTLTRRTAGMLAALGCRQRPPDLAAEELAWGDALQTTLGGWLFPIRIVMSRWARHLAGSATGCADDLLDECMRVVKEVANLPDARQKERLVQRLAADNPTALLLLDGLDEVADVAARQTLLAAVNDFAGCYPDVRLVVTCRVRPYQDGRHYRLSLPDVTLAPLRPAEIARFLTRWHTELARVGIYQPAAAADHARQRLQNAIDDPHRSELAAMAGTPLLLTMMARVNFKSGLPNSRAKLYEEYV